MDTHETDCKQTPGVIQPVIDRNRCEGKKECVAVCPYKVFTIATVAPELRRGLSLRGKLKGFAHRWQQAFASRLRLVRLLPIGPDADIDGQRHIERCDAIHQFRQLASHRIEFGLRYFEHEFVMHLHDQPAHHAG